MLVLVAAPGCLVLGAWCLVLVDAVMEIVEKTNDEEYLILVISRDYVVVCLFLTFFVWFKQVCNSRV